MAIFVLSLGSNHLASKHLDFAIKELEARADLLQLSPRVSTKPIDFPHSTVHFSNQLVEGYTPMPEEEFTSWLKSMEEACGRSPQAKLSHPERVSLDLDLILWNSELRKAEDLKRPYVRDALHLLGYGHLLDEPID